MTEQEILATIQSAMEKVRLEAQLYGITYSEEYLATVRFGIIMGVTEVAIRTEAPKDLP